MKVNLPIERHASKIYTRAMFEQFGSALYKAGAYELDVAIPKRYTFLLMWMLSLVRNGARSSSRLRLMMIIPFSTVSVVFSSTLEWCAAMHSR